MNFESGEDFGSETRRNNAGDGFGIIFCVLLCSNLPFIIANLIFASQQSPCVTTHVPGFSFTLQGWLEVDAYVRILVLVLILLTLFSFITSFGFIMMSCTLCFVSIYGVFSLIWTIVGAVLFWGKLDKEGVCFGSVSSYMNAMLILSFIGVCCNCCCKKNRSRG